MKQTIFKLNAVNIKLNGHDNKKDIECYTWKTLKSFYVYYEFFNSLMKIILLIQQFQIRKHFQSAKYAI